MIFKRSNSGQFKTGHKESQKTKELRSRFIKGSWPDRKNYHGMYGTKFYNSWRSMVTRCRGTAGEDSKRKYRDKGITVCDRWHLFKNFYEDMFPTYTEGLQIDRIENDKGYFKENCRWATPQQQSNNRTNNTRIEYNGKSLTLREWSIELNRNINTLRWNYYHKVLKGEMTLDRLFT